MAEKPAPQIPGIPDNIRLRALELAVDSTRDHPQMDDAVIKRARTFFKFLDCDDPELDAKPDGNGAKPA